MYLELIISPLILEDEDTDVPERNHRAMKICG